MSVVGLARETQFLGLNKYYLDPEIGALYWFVWRDNLSFPRRLKNDCLQGKQQKQTGGKG